MKSKDGHVLKQQTSINVYRLPTKENKLPFAENKRKFALFVFRLYILMYKYTSVYFYFSLYVCRYTYIYCLSNAKRKTEAQAIFLYLFTVCSFCKRKFVVCPFFGEETNGSYPFANGPNGINGLAHL
jgi:hypothetical protein